MKRCRFDEVGCLKSEHTKPKLYVGRILWTRILGGRIPAWSMKLKYACKSYLGNELLEFERYICSNLRTLSIVLKSIDHKSPCASNSGVMCTSSLVQSDLPPQLPC
uniref:Uncharacterized protein n=1 Tax=Ostreococcus mediterraneus TaxID=1486918 RepID=A0A7S0KFM1_9CHLO|mmetsp:Transcript_2392/g.8827  ORF Transcript_2392/g.8827 Transcript_2392/m.8827 type:complete len:106 (+) Transcript_2392:749-1066(+)